MKKIVTVFILVLSPLSFCLAANYGDGAAYVFNKLQYGQSVSDGTVICVQATAAGDNQVINLTDTTATKINSGQDEKITWNTTDKNGNIEKDGNAQVKITVYPITSSGDCDTANAIGSFQTHVKSGSWVHDSTLGFGSPYEKKYGEDGNENYVSLQLKDKDVDNSLSLNKLF